MKLPLPAIRTLNFHLQNLVFKSGVLDEIIGFLKITCESLNQDFGRDCMVAFDEIYIKAGVDYCVYSGTYIGGITLPKHEGVATKALVILVGGLILLAVTSDMGSANQAVWKTFGKKAGRKCQTKMMS
ncbi:hypothetical protein Zmor_009981 [Zophobas morio]|uniref:Transposable element P transposase-like RNase H domain-containing protein n=1 Tax=Zophobas morio TaxID=2755281 RepID=A0AA38II03_9CUCU|nr:hypothetical protein Zmor_009981 [Zophobas morio]